VDEDAESDFWRKLWATRESIQRTNMRRAGVFDYD
jgi:hypothetical protein